MLHLPPRSKPTDYLFPSTTLFRSISAALPLKVFPPLFNRYGPGQTFGTHVDNAIRAMRDADFRIRTDLSCTLFLAGPDEYDGGELVVEDTYGEHSAKLPADRKSTRLNSSH